MTQDSVQSETTTLVAVSEETPLLQANSEVTRTHPEVDHHDRTIAGDGDANGLRNGSTVDNDHDNDDDEEVPLPRLQIFLLCYCRVVEPIAFFSIFPYINQMIEDTGGLREEDVGFYSGLIESLFSLTQMTLMIFWGRAADRFGRKPVLVSSLAGAGVAIGLFGLSQKIWQMILFRCLAGVFSGTVVTIRALITENSTPKTQARAFSFFAFAGNLGIFFGPLIGGALANPAKQYGGWFANIEFLKQYPYSLPSFVAGAIGLSASLISGLFVKETLHPDKESSPGGKPAPPPMTTRELVTAPGISIVLFIYNYILLLGMAYTAVAPVFWFTSVRLGGLGLTPLQISAFLGAGGLSQAFWTLVIFPPAHKRWGTIGVMRFCATIWPISFLLGPLASLVLKKGWTPAFWVLMPVATVLGSGASMAFTCVQLALNDVSPSPAVLGTLNAIALAMACGIRALAPASFASLFAAGVKNQLLGGYFVWLILIPMAAGTYILVNYVPEKAQGKPQRKRTDEDED